MNIGIVTTWFERGAGYVSRQYRDLLKNDHNVYVYARGGEQYAAGDAAWDGPFVTWAKCSQLPVLTPIDEEDFRRWLTESSLDLVLFNEQRWWLPVLWCRELGLATCAYVDHYTKETVELFAGYDLLLCNTKRHYEAFSWHPGARYLPWGTDVGLFAPSTFEPVQNGVVTFFHSAGMSPDRKGTDLVIQAFAKLSGPKRLVLHSQRDLLTQFPDLAPLVADLSGRGELTIVGKTVPAPGCYHLGDVYVYPSRLEGIGLTVAEALACGLPAIVPDQPPMNEFVNEDCGKKVQVERLHFRYDGYYWPQCEVAIPSLVAQMQWYMDRRGELAQFKRAARRHAVEHLDWSHNKEDLLAMLNDLSRTSQDVSDAVLSYERAKARAEARWRFYSRYPWLHRIANAFSLKGKSHGLE